MHSHECLLVIRIIIIIANESGHTEARLGVDAELEARLTGAREGSQSVLTSLHTTVVCQLAFVHV